MRFDSLILQLVYRFNGYGVILYVLITTCLAAILAFFLGMERQVNGKSISIKTYVLLSTGCSLLMIISIWAIRVADGSIDILDGNIVQELNYDTSRIAAAVVSGMGFLGAGAIIKEKLTIRGISTAATLWICAAIGLACGVGFILEACLFTGIIILFQFIMSKITKRIEKTSPRIHITFERGNAIVEDSKIIADKNNIIIKKTHILDTKNENEQICEIVFSYNFKIDMIKYYIDLLNKLEYVKETKVAFYKHRNF